mmetsp:Transcript_48050/g.124578  ORF Transcript_48050/g.124578 Transcript_48050/m.124578 type:complete len:215 (-) Transcript_48050:870-1514(-)
MQMNELAEHEVEADEDQDYAQAVLEQVEHVHQIFDDEEHRPQPEHGEHAGAEGQVLVRDLGHLCADTVQGKHCVNELQAGNYHHQESHLIIPAHRVLHQHPASFVVRVKQAAAQHPGQALHQPGLLGVHVIVVVAPCGLDATPYEQCSERIAEPAEEAQQRGHDHEEDHAHDHRAHDAHERRLVDLVRGRLVCRKDEMEDEEVIHGKHPLQHIS